MAPWLRAPVALAEVLESGSQQAQRVAGNCPASSRGDLTSVSTCAHACTDRAPRHTHIYLLKKFKKKKNKSFLKI